jgi:hypothetical protein
MRGLSLVSSVLVFSLAPLAVLADADPNRDVACVVEKIGVTEAQFKTCFLPVEPDGDFNPSGKRQRVNKALLLPCLQEANPGLTNSALDRAMDACRPEGPIR